MPATRNAGIKMKYSKVNSAVYEWPRSNEVFHATDGKTFAWWDRKTFSLKPTSTSYEAILAKFEEAYTIWNNIKSMTTPSWASIWAEGEGKYTWINSKGGERPVTIKARGAFVTSGSDGRLFANMGTPETFYMECSSTPDVWTIRSATGKYFWAEVGKTADGSPYMTRRLILDSRGLSSYATRLWVRPYGLVGGVSLWTSADVGKDYYATATTEGMMTKTPLGTAADPSYNPQMFFIQDLNRASIPAVATVATRNMKLWNDTVIPSLLVTPIGGVSPLVDHGRIGEIARAWETDPDVDKTMMDSVKTDYCLVYPGTPECACLARNIVDATYRKLKPSLPMSDRCWYANCADVPGNGMVLITQRMVDDTKCVDVCQSLIQVIGSTDVNLPDVQQITTCQLPANVISDVDIDVDTRVDDTAAIKAAEKRKMLFAAVGSSVVAFAVAGIIITVLLMRE